MMDAFARALLDPALPPPPGLKTWNGSDPAVRFAVYRNNVMVSLIEALADTFPVVAQLVGMEFFRAMAREYVGCRLPSSPVLAGYGEDFPDFIAAFGPATSVPYLADVARLEAAFVQAFHAADAPVLSAEALQAALAEPDRLAELTLILHPSVRILRSAYAVVSLWAAHQGQGDLAAIDPSRAESALIVRTGLTVQVIALDPAAADFLADLAEGLPLGRAFERSAARGTALDLTALFALLLRTQALSALAHLTDSSFGDTP